MKAIITVQLGDVQNMVVKGLLYRKVNEVGMRWETPLSIGYLIVI